MTDETKTEPASEAKAPREPLKLTPLTPEEITTLARRIVTNEVFIANKTEALECAFGIIIAFSEWTREDAKQIGALWEEYSKAGPRSVNGYPSFFSCHILHKDSLPALRAECERMEAALGIKRDG